MMPTRHRTRRPRAPGPFGRARHAQAHWGMQARLCLAPEQLQAEPPRRDDRASDASHPRIQIASRMRGMMHIRSGRVLTAAWIMHGLKLRAFCLSGRLDTRRMHTFDREQEGVRVPDGLRPRPGGPPQHCTSFLSNPSIPPGTHNDTPFTRPDGSQFQRMEGLPGGAYVGLPVGDPGALCAYGEGPRAGLRGDLVCTSVEVS
jgi:hypothetical protein